MSRWKASAIHLSLSIFILATLAALLVWRWYPPGLFHMAQADKLLVLVGCVDVVLGPLITLIIYQHGKKGLKFDLAVIAVLQVAALVYGLNTAWQTRPVYLVASDRMFDLVFANEIAESDLAAASPLYRRLPLLGWKTVGIRVPTDAKEKARALELAMSGKDMQFIPTNYMPYSEVAQTVLEAGKPAADVLASLTAEDRKVLEAAVASTGRPTETVVLVPLSSSRDTAAMLLDARTGDILRPVAVKVSNR